MKKNIIQELRDKHGYSAADAEKAFEDVTSSIATTIRRDRVAQIPGIGRFTVKHMNSRTGRNPQTGETITIAARDKVSFKAAEKLI